LSFLVAAWLLADYSQFLSGAVLGLAGYVLLVFTFSLFLKKSTPINKFLKRLVDISLGSSFLFLMSPLFVVIALLIKLDSEGPIFYFEKRFGKDGKEFKMLKFRTTIFNADEILVGVLEKFQNSQEKQKTTHKLKSNQRITRVGKFLRKTSLNELPQMFNVVRGEMSLVGPQALRTSELDMLADKYSDIFKTAIPGITGLWQISQQHGTTYEERIRLDEYYVKNWSLWLDVIILARTCFIVISRTGAY
jgi:undecaprenyl-phosphate galactose phosphotransferase